ncbi:MAG: hypothetical protein IKK03_07560 [Lachnospiraceae bacterium]|nr:hypothetical protein [Lachnospiraceae bacterium]
MDKVFKSQKRLKKYNVNRFTACLLAVLMLFSALLTGSMTVHAEATDENVVKMPVYKNETEYEEANITMQQSPIEIGDNSFELIFRPYFGTSEMNALLAANGDATRVSIGIRLTWTDAEGNLQSKDLTYTEDMVKTVYAEIKAFRVIATGINSFENLTVTPLVKSQVFTNIECLGESEQVTVKSEYDAMVAAYEEAAILKYTTCFDDCADDTEVHNDKNIPSGEFYYLAKDSAYGGSVEYDFDGVNGYILMKEAYGQRIDVKPTGADAKYVIVESKIRYNTSGIKLEFGLRGVKSNGKASPATLGTIENGTFTTNTGDYSKTITSGEWHTFTYVLDINNKKYDLYIDEVKVTEESQGYSYFRGFQGDDFFRIKAASLTDGTTGADFMIDDIKVYGCTTDPTAITTE